MQGKKHQTPVFWAPIAWPCPSVLHCLLCFAGFWQLISNSTFKRQYVIWDKSYVCENVVGLSYKPRADVPTLIQKKVILAQFTSISISAEKEGIPVQTYPRWHRRTHVEACNTSAECV